jgi:nucleoside 2-deoxyribosyltransferase
MPQPAPGTPDRAGRRPLRIYLAAPLFTQTERLANRSLAAGLERELPGAAVTLPQDFKTAGRYNDRRSYRTLFARCLAAIDTADAVVAVLDGADADSGVAFEVGYAYARRVPVVAVRTDYRAGADRGVNAMLSQAAGRFVFDMAFREDPVALARDVAARLRSLLGNAEA